MAQILEVVVAMVVSAMMATAITTLALTPVKTQRQKNVYAASEATAIAVRKCIVDNPLTFKSDVDITTGNVSTTCLSTALPDSPDISCVVETNYKPVGVEIKVPLAIVCMQTNVTGNMSGLAWQPLYTVNSMIATSTTLSPIDFGKCMERWVSDSDATYSGKTAPSSEELASKYIAECGGLSDPFNFVAKDYNEPESPCAVTVRVGTKKVSSGIIVKFGKGTCTP